jgi:hypothetical protein
MADLTNLFADIPDDLPEELFRSLLSTPGLRIERIVSLDLVQDVTSESMSAAIFDRRRAMVFDRRLHRPTPSRTRSA